MFRLLISKEATFDVKDACEWYDNQKPGLSKNFREEVKNGYSFITNNPISLQIKYKSVRV